MKPSTLSLGAALGVALFLVACDDPNSLIGGNRVDPSAATDPNAALVCTDKPTGRSYASFDGSKLEAQRVNENSSANLARFKPFAVMGGEYERILGAAPAGLADAASSFDVPPDRWYAEPEQSAVSLSTAFDISFDACRTAITSQTDKAQAPTADTASDYCAKTMRKAWSRTPSPDEIGACTTLATQKLSAEPDPHRRWSYVCASILSSSNFLTY